MSVVNYALLTEAERLAIVADEIGGAFALELGRVLRDLERELRRLVLDAREGRLTALAQATRAARLRTQLQQALKAAGYPQLAETSTSVGLDRLVNQMSRLRDAARLAQFTTTDSTRIAALKALAEQDLLAQGEAIATALWRSLKYSLFSGRPAADVIDDLAEAIDVELTDARTLYDTLTNVFARQVEAMKSTGEPDEAFVYLGPLDVKTRPFCYARVGKVFARDEIEQMDNGQLPNPFLTAGGYNCRHQWTAVSKLSALRKLVGTDQRMPEVQQQLESLPRGDRKAA